jgi:hypothetical protein
MSKLEPPFGVTIQKKMHAVTASDTRLRRVEEAGTL